MTEFEQEVLKRLDEIIYNQKRGEIYMSAGTGVDVDHLYYSAKYNQIKKRADLKRSGANFEDASLDELGIETER